MAKFYLCKICGNIVEKVEDSGLVPYCCNKKMTLLDPHESEGATEKHIPVFTTCKLTTDATSAESSSNKFPLLVHVEIGSEPHPNQNNHYIKWIELETDKGVYRHFLQAADTPKTDFVICDCEKILAVYAYCNIHGLWVCTKCKS